MSSNSIAWLPGDYGKLASLVDCHEPQFMAVIDDARRGLGRGFGEVKQSLPPLEASCVISQVIYESLRLRTSLVYDYEKAAPGIQAQEIRRAGYLLNGAGDKSATCLDLALLYAAPLELAHLNPVIVILDLGESWHALAGCFALDGPEFAPPVTQGAEVKSAAEQRKLVPVEITRLARFEGRKCSFEDAVRDARQIMNHAKPLALVDLVAARKHGILPLFAPERGKAAAVPANSGSSTTVVQPASSESDTKQSTQHLAPQEFPQSGVTSQINPSNPQRSPTVRKLRTEEALGYLWTKSDAGTNEIIGWSWPLARRQFVTDPRAAQRISALRKQGTQVFLRWPANGTADILVQEAILLPHESRHAPQDGGLSGCIAVVELASHTEEVHGLDLADADGIAHIAVPTWFRTLARSTDVPQAPEHAFTEEDFQFASVMVAKAEFHPRTDSTPQYSTFLLKTGDFEILPAAPILTGENRIIAVVNDSNSEQTTAVSVEILLEEIGQ